MATFGLRRTADVAEQKYGADVKHLVHRNFYVDDALSSHPSEEEAIDLLRRTRAALQEFGNLRLHKIASNSSEVLSAFESDDLAKELKNLELGIEGLPPQRSLGIHWNLQTDEFTFHVVPEEKPFTRRCVLSCVNSVFDPLGFIAPVTIAGKAILREAMSDGADWDEPLRPDCRHRWEQWKSSLQHLQNVKIQRTYGGMSLCDAVKKELCIFSDASEMAIAAVVYIRLTDSFGSQRLGFMLGKAKLAPKHGHTIPRLELCAAVLATELYETVRDEIDMDFDRVQFYTDSKVVLGYIRNETKRFFIYVEHRVDRIRRCSNPSDWNYVCSKLNPADEGTRSVTADNIQESLWLNGPTHLLCDVSDDRDDVDYPLVGPEKDCEVRTLKTDVAKEPQGQTLHSSRFEYFATWHRLVRAIANAKHLAARWKKTCTSQHLCNTATDPDAFKRSEQFVVKVVQNESFHREIEALASGKHIPRNSSILRLDPYLDDNGVLRVGGRLKNSNLPQTEKNPLILPKKHHISTLIVAHYHQEVQHQGRLFTEGAIRTAGYWIVGCRRLINSHLQKCVRCLKLRGKPQSPKMADLPPERLDLAPPFTYVGIDVFGPWTIVTRRTRGGQAHSKRWAVIFTCLLIRAVHIEVIEEMTSSSFINALRRFTALRGEVKFIRSDCGTNFVGAAKELNSTSINVEDPNFRSFLTRKGITWRFNPPHSSHMGGAWERLIGVSRRILDSLLMDVQHKNLTHEVLITLMAEVCSIINARPIAGVSADPTSTPLTPSTLLCMKTKHTVDSFCVKDFTSKDIYKDQWRCVQHLANCFWKRWKGEYLSSIQERRKWHEDRRNLQEGDVVLLRDKSVYRNEWPIGVVEKAIPSGDDRVRKIEVRVGTDRKVYSRPASEVVLLVPTN